jgi:hypothetical protein
MARNLQNPGIRFLRWCGEIAAGIFLRRRSSISAKRLKWAMVGTPIVLMLLAVIFMPMRLPSWAGISRSLSRPEHPLSPLFHSSVRRWEAEIQRWANGYGLDPNFVATIMQIESCGNANAISTAGARGLFQVMPNHFSADENPLEPDTNARRGLEYLATALLLSNGDIEKTLAGYNGGHGVMFSTPDRWPAETQRYVYWGAGIYMEAKSGASESHRLNEWLAAGGATLCKRAD